MKFHSLTFFVAAATTPTGTSAIEADAEWNSNKIRNRLKQNGSVSTQTDGWMDDVNVDRINRINSLVSLEWARASSTSSVYDDPTPRPRLTTDGWLTTTKTMFATTMTMTSAKPATVRAGKMMMTKQQQQQQRARTTIVTCAKKTSKEDENGPMMKPALAGALAASIMLTGAMDPGYAEAARSGGRVGGGSFRSSSYSRAAPRMSAQSRTAPPVGGYGGYGYNSVFMPMPIMPMYGFGFGFGGMGFLFNLMFFFFILNTVLGFLQQFNEQNNSGNRRDDDEDFY